MLNLNDNEGSNIYDKHEEESILGNVEQNFSSVKDQSSKPLDKDKKWEDFNLKREILSGIYAAGFQAPSHIQTAAIPLINEGKCIRARSQSGTGKTGAFTIGLLNKIDTSINGIQGIIIASTREIARQILDLCVLIGAPAGIKILMLTGGSDRLEDIAMLNSKKFHVIVGTPGRVVDMLECKAINPTRIKMWVLDEADELCKPGFCSQLQNIYSFFDYSQLQILFFSATYKDDDLDVISKIVQNPEVIEMCEEEYKLQGIKHYKVVFNHTFGDLRDEQAKLQQLHFKIQIFKKVVEKISSNQVLIFAKRKADTILISKILNDEGYPSIAMTADLDQEERNEIIAKYSCGHIRILVASDLCKRGLDIQSLSVVICMDVPKVECSEDYLHRVGRTGRFGRTGAAVSICDANEAKRLDAIGTATGITILDLPEDFGADYE